VTQPNVNVDNFIKVVTLMLNDHVVGYSGVIRNPGNSAGFSTFANGDARVPVDGVVTPDGKKVALPFSPDTPCGLASVSKFLTALAAVQLLDGPSVGNVEGTPVPGFDLDTCIYLALPKDWQEGIRDPGVQLITFRDLLMHTSGLVGEGDPNVPNLDYASLLAYISQKTVITETPLAKPAPPPAPRYPVNYSNVGFALFRILLPMVHSMQAPPGSNWWKDNPSLPVDGRNGRAQAFADEYERIIQDNVFGRVAVTGPSTGTPDGPDTFAFGYTWPGNSPGIDQSGLNLGLDAGPGAWFVSINQIRPVLESLSNDNDNRILTKDQWNHMQSIDVPTAYANLGNGLGIDLLTDPANGYRWVEKNGGFGNQTASIAFFGSMVPDGKTDGPLFAALFMNSDIWGGPGSVSGWYQCTQCNTLFSNGGVCPATRQAKQPHKGGGEYILSTNEVPDGQRNWARCANCGALCYEASPVSPSSCPAVDGGRHHLSGGGFIVGQTGLNDLENQADWRRCENCGVLAQSWGKAQAGVCTHGGGMHTFDLSGSSYALMNSYGPDVVLLQAFRDSIE
jgi:CubicO group peptidase (beta-lactamase class C family)